MTVEVLPSEHVAPPPIVIEGSSPVAGEPKRRAQKPRSTTGVKHLSDSQVDQFFAQIKSTRDRAIFRLALHRGLRASEIGLIQFNDWDNREGTLLVRRLKGSITSSYRLLPVEAQALRAWIRLRGSSAGPMFPSRNHKPIGRDRLDELIKEYGAAARIPSDLCHMHVLKHTCGTYLLRELGDVMLVRDWLGHRKLENTMKYAQVVKREQATQKVSGWGKR